MPTTAEPAYVIAICGPSGAGKSTAIAELARRLGGATVLRIDDYEASSTYPETASWLAEGADPNAFVTPQLVADLRALRSGVAVSRPDASGMLDPTPFVIVEEPFGRERDQMRELIDFVVHVDVPLEVALARKILRRNDFLPWEQDPERFIANLRGFLSWYLADGRAFYLATRERVLRRCDLLVDGTRAPQEVVDAIYGAVLASRP